MDLNNIDKENNNNNDNNDIVCNGFDKYQEDKKRIEEDITSLKEEIKRKKNEKKELKKVWKRNKDERSKVRYQKHLLRVKKDIAINQPPHLSVLEEIGNAVTHGLGSCFSIVATILMLVYSDSIKDVVSASIYGACMIILFTMSCLYHSFQYGSTVKRIFRRFDYSSIYLLIGGTFTPILLLLLNNTLSLVVLIIMWSIIAIGITFVCIFGPGRLKWLHFPIYFILGWLGGIVIIPKMLSTNLNLFWWILIGGIIYTIGIITFCFKERKSAHFVWHFFVVAGAILQWIGIFLYLYN